jgi:hypothetical protein
MAAGEPFSSLSESLGDLDDLLSALGAGASLAPGAPGEHAGPGPVPPPLPVRNPGAAPVREAGEHVRALDDPDVLRRVLAGLRRF